MYRSRLALVHDGEASGGRATQARAPKDREGAHGIAERGQLLAGHRDGVLHRAQQAPPRRGVLLLRLRVRVQITGCIAKM
jgi:hypothetical protein